MAVPSPGANLAFGFLSCASLQSASRRQNCGAYLGLRIDCQGRKDLLRIWLGEQERSKFWLKVLTDLKNRGVKDLLITCTDGLAGFAEA